ncbi:MAG: glycerate kinase [Actinomycetota bacterium]|nr:glycerate kinase [Actinomycetota bacterium]
MRALASPASLKGVLSAGQAAFALAEGLRAGGAEPVELPVADGGEGTLDVLSASLGGEWREAEVSDPLGRPVRARWLLLEDGTALVESAEAIGLALVGEEERDPLRASSRGLGELIAEVMDTDPAELLVFLGGTATVDGGEGLMEVLGGFRVPVRAACDVRAPLLDAVWVFAEQKGATAEQLGELERRLLSKRSLAPFRGLSGAGAAGGLGAAMAALGAEVVAGAPLVLELIGFRERLRGIDLVVTGEGTVDPTTWIGKAPGEVVRVCAEAEVRCVLFGGRVVDRPEGVDTYELSGDPARAREDLVELGRRLVGQGRA